MRKPWTILTLLIAIALEANAQDPVFSQYYSSSLYLNPALAGIEKQTTIGANYRSQWNKILLPFNTFQMSMIHPLFQRGARKKHQGGVGLSVLNDTAGPSREYALQSITFSAAYNMQIGPSSNHVITLALQAGASQQKVSNENLRWTSQYSPDAGYDPTMPGESTFNNTRVFQPIIGSGLLWSYSSSQKSPVYYNGLVLSNLLRSQSRFDGMAGSATPTFKAHGGMTLPVSHVLDLSPNYLVQRQGSNQQINVGMYAGYNITNTVIGDLRFTFGSWYRVSDAFIVSGGFSTKKMSVAYSFDNNVASLGRSFGNASANELSMTYRLPGKNNFRRISSPLI